MDKLRKYYVYKHFDPETEELVYIGKGCGGRAWDVTRAKKENREHQDWMQTLCSKGFTPEDWVEICYKGLTEQQALRKEKELLNSLVTRFNRTTGEKQHQAKMTNDEARWAYLEVALRGRTHREVADTLGVSRSAISMLVSGRQWKAITADLRSSYGKV